MHICVRVFMRVHACVRVSVISGLSILLRIKAKPINSHSLYTRQIALIFVMRDYFLLFLFVGNVVQREAFDHAI